MTTFVASMGRERLYKASATEPEIVQVPGMSFVMVDGHGDPNTAKEYSDAIQALYSCSYTLKFALKKEQGLEYRVGPLEGLWWADHMAAFGAGRKGEWDWTAMIAQPDELTDERFEAAREELQGRRICRRSLWRGSSASRRARARRSCTSGRTARRARRSSDSTSSSEGRAIASTAGSRSTTRST